MFRVVRGSQSLNVSAYFLDNGMGTVTVSVEAAGGYGLGFSFCKGFEDGGGVGTGEGVGSSFDEFYPFGFVAQGDAGLLEEVGFLLQAAAVGHDEVAVFEQPDHFEVADGVYDSDAGGV